MVWSKKPKMSADHTIVSVNGQVEILVGSGLPYMTRIALVADSGPVTSESNFISSIVRGRRKQEPTGLQAVDGLIFSFGLVALGYNRRDSVHGDSQREIGASQSAMVMGITNEQHALLIPDMFVEKQWKGGVLKRCLVASNGLWKVRNGLYFIWGDLDEKRTYE